MLPLATRHRATRATNANVNANVVAAAAATAPAAPRAGRTRFPAATRFAGRASRAFTMIEILAVITIIAILSAAIFSLSASIAEHQNVAMTKGYIKTLGVACEEFKATFNEYPTHEGDSSDEQQWRLALYASLSGLKVLKLENDKIRFVNFDETSADGQVAVKRPFITDSSFRFSKPTGEAIDESMRYFVDGWDNPIAYRYNVISGGEMGKTWLSPRFLLVSAGAKVHDPLDPVADYFTGSMQLTGQVSKEYENAYRADNIMSWKND